jgi:UDP-N-acetylmuramate--alanine ligase
VIGVGESADAGLRCVDLAFEGTTSAFDVLRGDERLGRVSLAIPGRHYVLDALAALAVGLRLGYSFDDLRRGLEGFTGTRRRMERKGESGGVRVYDSYAHHPVEIAGDLQAGRAVAGDGRLIVAFQPHLVSRTRTLGPAMGRALGAADEVVVCDVYLSRDDADPEVTGALVASAVPLPPEQVAFVPDLGDVPAALVSRARPGDLVLTLGAGSITDVGPRVLELLADDMGGDRA